MADHKVKVTIAKGVEVHHHKGTQVYPGDEIEIWESQARHLLSIRVIDPYDKKKKSSRKPARDPATEADIAAEEDAGGDTTTEG